MNIKIEIQEEFENLIKNEYPLLEPIKKWNQKMWHKKGNLIVSLIFLSKKLKFCFFNNPNIELHKLQRWSSTIYSQNLEYKSNDEINWDKIRSLINETIKVI
jgi:hypothetical protein